MENRKSFEPSDFEKKLRDSIIEEFKKVCPFIKVKEEDINKAKEEGMTDEEVVQQFFAVCIENLYREIYVNDKKS